VKSAFLNEIRERCGIGCTDHGCIWGHPGGMGTNGGCRCLVDDDRKTLRVSARAVGLLATRVAELEAENGKLREAVLWTVEQPWNDAHSDFEYEEWFKAHPVVRSLVERKEE